MLNCKNATKLMSKAQDIPLALKERVALRIHLAMCSGCNNYNKHMSYIRKACKRIGGYNK